MYLSGHDSILDLALAALPKFLSWFSDEKGVSQAKTALYEGGHIPDVPCITFTRHDQKGLIIDLQKCGTFRSFVNILDLKRKHRSHTVTYQYHRGFNALLHATTNNKTMQMTNRQVASKIIRRLTAMFRFALLHSDPLVTLKMLGLIIHTIIDSYSPSHTFRISSAEMKNEDRHCDYNAMKPAGSENDIGDLIVEVITHDIGRRKTWTSEELIQTLIENSAIHRYFEQHPKLGDVSIYFHERRDDLVQLAYNLYFFQQIENASPYRGRKVAQSAFPFVATYKYIYSFQNPARQFGIDHNLYDRISVVKKMELFDSCVNDVVLVLQIVAEHYQNGKSERIATKNFYDLLTHRIFHIFREDVNKPVLFRHSNTCMNYIL